MEMDHPETLGWLKDALAEETVGLRLHHHHLELEAHYNRLPRSGRRRRLRRHPRRAL